jgi:hypothetical protein
MKPGDTVNYHATIGGPVSSRGHTIEQVDTLVSGLKLIWISGKKMCVSAFQISSKDNEQ